MIFGFFGRVVTYESGEVWTQGLQPVVNHAGSDNVIVGISSSFMMGIEVF